MKFNEIEKDIIRYVMGVYENPNITATPCIEVLQHVFKEKYSGLEVHSAVLELISSGVLRSYSFHAYLELTETFKTSAVVNTFREKKNE